MLPDPKIVNHKLYAQLYDECARQKIDTFWRLFDAKKLDWIFEYDLAHFWDGTAFVGGTYQQRAQAHQDRFFELQAETLRIGREMLDAHSLRGGSHGE